MNPTTSMHCAFISFFDV
uniref:Uncharacterized protein n=1 Tax=Rhizophora mucronata TaxID=61149 RepID=A0A2P2QD52_RHIMU